MNSWIDFFYFFICGAALLLSVLALWFTIIMPGIDRWSKRFFLLFFTVLMLNCFSALLETVLLRYPVPIPPVIFLLVLESLFLALPLPMLTVYLLHCSGEDIRNSRLFRTVSRIFCPGCGLPVHRQLQLYHAGQAVFPRASVPASAAADDFDHAAESRRHDPPTEPSFP